MNLKKAIALLVSLVFVSSAFATAASAVTYRVGGTSGTTAISSSYSSSIYNEYLSKINLTGDGRLDTVAIALSQIGYQEGNDDTQFAGTYPGSKNFTEFNRNFGDYGSGYGNEYNSSGTLVSQYAWCAAFVSFSLYQARTHNYSKMSDWCRAHDGDSNYIWKEISCIQWLNQLDSFGYFKKSPQYGGTYVPRTGDLIFFGESSSKSNHIGIVVYSDGTNVYTVEGNTSQAAGLEANGGGVYFKSYALTNSRIRGYGVLPYKTNSSAFAPDYTGKMTTTGIYINTNYNNTGSIIRAYSDEACTKGAGDIKTNTLFEITGFVSETVAQCTFYRTNSSGVFAKVTGYIKTNASCRVVQAASYGEKYTPSTTPTHTCESKCSTCNKCLDTACTESACAVKCQGHTTPTPTPDTNNTFVAIDKGNGYVAHSLANYTLNGESCGMDSRSFTMTAGDSLGIVGFAGFSQSIVNSGYFLDNDRDNVYWNSNFLSAGDSAATATAGNKAMNFNMTIDAASIPEGEHTVNFMLKLADGTFVIVETLTVNREADNAGGEQGGDTSTGGDAATPGEETTTAPASNDKSRCGSSVSGISVILIAIASAITAFVSRKKKR